MAPDRSQFSGRERLSPPVDVDPARVHDDHASWLQRSRAAWDARAERWDARAEVNALAPDRGAELDRIWDALRLGRGARVPAQPQAIPDAIQLNTAVCRQGIGLGPGVPTLGAGVPGGAGALEPTDMIFLHPDRIGVD